MTNRSTATLTVAAFLLANLADCAVLFTASSATRPTHALGTAADTGCVSAMSVDCERDCVIDRPDEPSDNLAIPAERGSLDAKLVAAHDAGEKFSARPLTPAGQDRAARAPPGQPTTLVALRILLLI